MTSSRDCLLACWQIALCGQQRGQVARVSFGEAHWTAGGWSTGCGGDWECFSRGATWSQPFPGVGAERHLYKYHLFQVFISVLLPHYLYFDVCKSDETPPPERLRPRFFVDIFFASSLAKVSENPRAESWHTDDSYQCVHKRVKCFKFAAEQPPRLVPQAHMTALSSSWYVPDKYKTKMVRNPIRKMKTIWTDKLEVANWQTGGGAKSGPALTWIDLRKLCQGKCLRWHPAEFKKVCKYGATMHIEGSRSLWRKIIRSGGLRSPNPLRSMGWGTWLPLTRLSKNREVTCYYAVRCVRCRCKGNHLLNLLNFTVNLKVTGDL